MEAAANQPGLAGLVDAQPPALEYEETVVARGLSGAPARNEVGKGRVFYLPAVRFDGPLPPPSKYFNFGNQYWKRPRNWQELVEGVRWAAKGPLPVEAKGPEHLVENLTTQPDRRRQLLHLLNYNGGTTPVANVEVSCRLPEAAQVKEIKLISPHYQGTRFVVATKTEGSIVSFTVPEVRVYTVAVVSW
jgi:hypothetical protein